MSRRDPFAALAISLALLLTACAESHERIEALPLYVHLCAEMPAADQELWGAAAGVLNAEQGEQVLLVGHGPVPARAGCGFVDVCPDPRVAEGAELAGGCVVTVRYAPGSAGGARDALEAVLGGVP